MSSQRARMMRLGLGPPESHQGRSCLSVDQPRKRHIDAYGMTAVLQSVQRSEPGLVVVDERWRDRTKHRGEATNNLGCLRLYKVKKFALGLDSHSRPVTGTTDLSYDPSSMPRLGRTVWSEETL